MVSTPPESFHRRMCEEVNLVLSIWLVSEKIQKDLKVSSALYTEHREVLARIIEQTEKDRFMFLKELCREVKRWPIILFHRKEMLTYSSFSARNPIVHSYPVNRNIHASDVRSKVSQHLFSK